MVDLKTCKLEECDNTFDPWHKNHFFCCRHHKDLFWTKEYKDTGKRKEYDRLWYDRNAEKKKAYTRNQPLHLKAKAQKKCLQKPGGYAAKKARQRAKRAKSKVSFADIKKINKIYAARPDGFEVDHIIPIRAQNSLIPVNGFHVHWNLQYLTKSLNSKKKAQHPYPIETKGWVIVDDMKIPICW